MLAVFTCCRTELQGKVPTRMRGPSPAKPRRPRGQPRRRSSAYGDSWRAEHAPWALSGTAWASGPVGPARGGSGTNKQTEANMSPFILTSWGRFSHASQRLAQSQCAMSIAPSSHRGASVSRRSDWTTFYLKFVAVQHRNLWWCNTNQTKQTSHKLEKKGIVKDCAVPSVLVGQKPECANYESAPLTTWKLRNTQTCTENLTDPDYGKQRKIKPYFKNQRRCTAETTNIICATTLWGHSLLISSQTRTENLIGAVQTRSLYCAIHAGRMCGQTLHEWAPKTYDSSKRHPMLQNVLSLHERKERECPRAFPRGKVVCKMRDLFRTYGAINVDVERKRDGSSPLARHHVAVVLNDIWTERGKR